MKHQRNLGFLLASLSITLVGCSVVALHAGQDELTNEGVAS